MLLIQNSMINNQNTFVDNVQFLENNANSNQDLIVNN